MNGRATILALLALGAVPFAARAQQSGKVFRMGLLLAGRQPPPDRNIVNIVAIPAMRELGYVEDGNLHVERRYADGELEGLPELAAELVRLKVDLIWQTPISPRFPRSRRPHQFEFVVNAKAAKGLGLKVPQSLLVRANELFEQPA